VFGFLLVGFWLLLIGYNSSSWAFKFLFFDILFPLSGLTWYVLVFSLYILICYLNFFGSCMGFESFCVQLLKGHQ
jgi:hypothetical protein